ncbi:C39 family peptidase [Lactobacillus amylovorus]|uniref:C39 family peptidase n=1 Tax=Lactobacillus amylovorus TaxID=1604 RepID=UPI00232E96B0|nr:C39 family peptidase [Lactobacillus amylovorus]MDB6241726.1 C39 family peptidase [Lactobacillus amylovorus]
MKHKNLILLATLFSAGLMLTTSQSVSADTVAGSNETSVNNSSNSNTNNSNNNLNTKDPNSSSYTDSSQNKNENQNQTENKEPEKNESTTNKQLEAKTQPKVRWISQNGKRYYLVNNKPTKGLKQIDKNWYLFDKNGAMLTKVRKIPKQSNYGYFGQDGKRKFKNTKTSRTYYWINKSGSITGIKNYAKVICQRPEMPTGCEITAVTMMINFAGKNITKDQAAKIMPRSLNPNKGFIGSPYKKFPLGFWVAPNGVKPVVKHYLGTATNMTGCSIAAIKKKLIRSHLVVAWVGWFDGFSNHAIALTGYHGNTLYYNDPWTGTKRSMSVATFQRHWALDGHRALSY